MKVYAVYIMLNDGTCIFDQPIRPMPESALITAMISAMQAFIKEVSGSYAKKLSTGGFVFHVDRVGKLVFVLASSEDERPDSELSQLRTRFLHKYGSKIDDFRGVTDEFAPFQDDVEEIFDIKVHERRVEPTKQLNSFALLQIPKGLQDASRFVVMKKKVTVGDLRQETNQTSFQARSQLEELFEMGYVGRYHNGRVYVYFI